MTNKVCHQSSNMRSCHGGSRDGVGRGVTSVPGGDDVDTRTEDVNDLTVVGEVGDLVVDIGSTDGDGLRNTSR